MRKLVPLVIRPWMLPLIVAALAVPIAAGFLLAGPPLGLAFGALAVAVVLIAAGRARFDEPIEVASSPDRRYRLLIVASEPLAEPELVERIAAIAADGRRALEPGESPQALVLAPALAAPLDRWASDLGGAREGAGRVLAISLAALATAGLDAEGRIGDPDPVQAISDALVTFSAREAVLVEGPGLGAEQAQEVGRRLDRPVRLLSAEPAD